MSQYINLALLILILYGAYYLMNRFTPITRFSYQSNSSKEELRARFGPVLKRAILGSLVVLPLLLLGIKWVVNYLIIFRISFLEDVLIVVPPPSVAVWLVSIVLTLLLGLSAITTLIYNSILTDWEEYLFYLNSRFRFDLVYYANYTSRITSLLMILVMYMMFDWFNTFGDEEVKLNGFWGLGTSKYPYAAITEIKDVSKRRTMLGNFIEEPYYTIVFKDGSEWNSLYDGFSTYEENRPVISVVTNRVGVYVRQLEYE